MRTAATEWKLRQKRAAVARQERTLARLVSQLALTGHWRTAGMRSRMAYADFQAHVPLQTYAALAPAIEQMKTGARDVLWPGACRLFVQSSGATTGTAKTIPATEEFLEHVRRGVRDAVLYYTVRARHAGVFRGRHLLLGGAAALAAIAEAEESKAYAAELSGIIPLILPNWADRNLYEPGAAAAQLAEWEPRVDAIIARSCRRDVSLIGGVPTWVAEFAAEVASRYENTAQQIPNLQALWPNLEVFVHAGESIAPLAPALRTRLGTGVKFHEVYAASEAFIAAQDTEAPAAGLRLMADLGVFFEFLPLAEFAEDRLASLGPKAVPLGAVQPDVDYVLILTAPNGLVRYVVGDVVRFVSTTPPRLMPRGRTALRLHAFGENVLERDLGGALSAVCNRHNWSIVNFHVAPWFASNLTGQPRGCHEWWVELEAGTVATPTGPLLAAGLDAELQRSNADYAAKRKAAVLDVPSVRLVMPGVFEHWQRYQNRWGGQHRVPRSRNDRGIAEELMQIANFARA